MHEMVDWRGLDISLALITVGDRYLMQLCDFDPEIADPECGVSSLGMGRSTSDQTRQCGANCGRSCGENRAGSGSWAPRCSMLSDFTCSAAPSARKSHASLCTRVRI